MRFSEKYMAEHILYTRKLSSQCYFHSIVAQAPRATLKNVGLKGESLKGGKFPSIQYNGYIYQSYSCSIV